jgi:ATP/maltotriose-dependent transcriptional regulator MalT
VYDRDVSNAEREALLTLELDPVNATGSAPIAYFSLGKLSVIEGDREQAKEYFVKAMQSFAVEESALYPLLSLVRFANILEMEGRRTEAIAMYERAITEGYKNPSLYTPAIVEAERYLLRPFVSSDALWFGLY